MANFVAVHPLTGHYGLRKLSKVVRLLAAASRGVFFDRAFNHFTGFAGDLLNPADQFLLFAFSVGEVIIREFRPFLFQLAFGDIPVAFNFECGHIVWLFWLFMFFIRQLDGKVYGLSFASQAHQEGMSHHQGERDDCSHGYAGCNLHFDNPCFNIHAQQHPLTSWRTPWGETPTLSKNRRAFESTRAKIGCPSAGHQAVQCVNSSPLAHGNPEDSADYGSDSHGQGTADGDS